MNLSKLHVKSFTLSQWQTNCYVIHTTITPSSNTQPQAWIIDCGFQPELLINYLKENNLNPTKLILTHAHLDHIGGIELLRKTYPKIPIYIHKNEEHFLTDPTQNLGAFYEMNLIAPTATHFLKQDDTLEFAGITFNIIETPGHSPGSISLHAPALGLAIVGDTLMAGSMGRSDFPHSNPQDLYHSIKQKLLTLPPQTTILSGHGPSTTVQTENDQNPYFQEVH